VHGPQRRLRVPERQQRVAFPVDPTSQVASSGHGQAQTGQGANHVIIRVDVVVVQSHSNALIFISILRRRGQAIQQPRLLVRLLGREGRVCVVWFVGTGRSNGGSDDVPCGLPHDNLTGLSQARRQRRQRVLVNHGRSPVPFTTSFRDPSLRVAAVAAPARGRSVKKYFVALVVATAKAGVA